MQLLVVMLICLTGAIFAGGFQLNEHGARALAMGNAFTSVADDPSAIYWNGAGLSFIEGTQVMGGINLIAPVTSFRGVYPSVQEYDMVKQVFTPFHVYATHNMNNGFAFGLGITVPYGLGSEWNEDWVGRYLAVKTDVMAFTVTPVVAYKVMENLSVSAGLSYSWATVKIAQKSSQRPFAGDAFVHLEGKDNSAFGYNFGVMYKPITGLSLGASFRSEIKYDFKGTATSTGASQLSSSLPSGDIKANLTTPVNISFGASYQLLQDLKIAADVEFVGWSSYDTLAIDFVNANLKDIASPRDYKDTYYLRFGAEYNLLRNLMIAGGIYYDKQPVETNYLNPSLPDGNRLGFSAGLTYKMNNGLTISGTYLFVRAAETTVSNSMESYTPGFTPFNGTYNSSATIASVTLTYGF